MVAKVNLNLVLNTQDSVVVKLWDVDVLKDDLLESKNVSKSGHVEFIFSTSKSGEINPELQVRIETLEGIEIYRTPINSSISEFNINEVTGFKEVSAIDFGTIEI